MLRTHFPHLDSTQNKKRLCITIDVVSKNETLANLTKLEKPLK